MRLPDKPYDKAIISDSSCLIALANIDRLDILKQLYKEIIITPEVAAEYKKPLPEWIVKKTVKDRNLISEIEKNNLHIGESSAIALAMETENSVLILDENRARNYALKKGLTIIGTLTIIGNACDKGYIENYEAVCEDLRKNNFWFTKKIQDNVRKNAPTEESVSKSPKPGARH